MLNYEEQSNFVATQNILQPIKAKIGLRENLNKVLEKIFDFCFIAVWKIFFAESCINFYSKVSPLKLAHKEQNDQSLTKYSQNGKKHNFL